MSEINLKALAGVWSASPTPFTENMEIDVDAIGRMVEHHLRLGIKGVFLAGTCGEGPWMSDAQRVQLVREVAERAAGRLALAVQVTDNSAARIIDNIHRAEDAGADVVVIAPPFFLLNATAENLTDLYLECIDAASVPVGIYDRGTHGAVVVPDECLPVLYAQPKVAMVKDSSSNPDRREIALAARDRRPDLLLLDGDEFHTVEYLQAGYDGLLLGGGIFNGYIAGQIMAAVKAGDIEQAKALEERMIRLMYDVYGGPRITCWLAGEKRLMVALGVFNTWRHYLRYPLTAECEQAILTAVEQDADILLP